MEKSVEVLSREIDDAMAKEDFAVAAAKARDVLQMSVDDVGTEVIMRASVIYAYALLKMGQKDESRKILQSLVQSGMGLTDAYFLLFCISYEERNTREILDFGKKFIDIVLESDEEPECVTTAVANYHEVVNNFASALLEMGQDTEAIETLRKGIEKRNSYPLLYVNLAVALFRNSEPEEAESVLREGLKHCEDKGELYRTLGLIYLESNLFMRAEIDLRNALEHGSVEAHMDLGILYSKLSKLEDAEEQIQNYLKNEPGESNATKMLFDLRALPYYNNREEKISVAMIVKNEEEMIAECIESVREAVDEIVVVDTGSTDKTVEILEEYNVELYHHEWKNDFSEARNFSISKTTGDWILIIDADERLEREDIPKVRALKWAAPFDVMCFSVYSTLPGNVGDANFGKHYSPRIFRKKSGAQYYGIVHNVLDFPGKAGVTDIRLYHLGYDLNQEKMEAKFERSLKLLLKQVEDDPENPFVLMNTAQMYLSRNYYEEGEQYASRCVELLKDDPGEHEHLLLMGMYQLSLVYFQRRDFEKCEEIGQKALEIKENYIDVLLSLGWCYALQKKNKEAADVLQKFLNYREVLINTEEFNLIILSKLGSDYEAHYLLGEIMRDEGDYEKAKQHFRKSLESNSLYWKVHNSLGKILLQEGSYAEAALSFENAVKYGYLNAEKYGTTGSTAEQYREAIENYRLSLEKDINAQKAKPAVNDALGKIDALLDED